MSKTLAGDVEVGAVEEETNGVEQPDTMNDAARITNNSVIRRFFKV